MKILKPQNIDDLDNEYLKNISDGEKAVYCNFENENSDGSEENETAIEPDRSDDEVRDELTGQHRLF